MNTDFHRSINYPLREFVRQTFVRRGKQTMRRVNKMRRSNGFSLSNLCKSAFVCGCFLLLICTTPPAFAQHGGKAEPLRIEFKSSTISTTINGVVHGDEQAEYVLAAKKGQRLIIKLSGAPAK